MMLRDFELTALRDEDIVLNEPVAWSIYDEFGKLLLTKGTVVRSERQREILLKVGLYAREILPDPKDLIPKPVHYRRKVNPFAEFDELCLKLEEVFKYIEEKDTPPEGAVQKRIFDICTHIQGLCYYDADALLGAVHLSDNYPYHIHHPMQMAVLAELIAARLELEQEERLALLAASLTCNIAMNPYQCKLHMQRNPLNEQQRRVINKHPQQSVAILRKAGVENDLWLELILQHHEKLDGTGYPRGLSGDDVLVKARIIALTDVYTAMITPRPYRQAIGHRLSLRELFIKRGQVYDEKLTMLFLQELGLYPPGVYVRLENGELAVVVGRTDDPKSPLVASIRKPDGDLFLSPRRRNTSTEGFNIQAAVTERLKINPALLWGIGAIEIRHMAEA
ncbi:HD domain-containing protein [Allopseudospirillum japonicum]|uniref:HD domain-containing protein n=1 Tax=Allopseudospirillum japonicum TaxID=64971 RepID=A0A1H6QXX2_9GAMM|nr:HD domain-containing phosphohydrolase [Allopseudospirillum japonicum]SEI45037.1 HD domain-containing protein [Allopseudospirillum japonicum]